MDEGIFYKDGDSFVPRSTACGPWDPNKLHGGPVAGLLAYAGLLEPLPSKFRIVRFGIDLLRPVPMKPLTVQMTPVRSGRRLILRDSELFCDGRLCARASIMMFSSVNHLPGGTHSTKELRTLPETLQSTHLSFPSASGEAGVGSGFSNTVDLRPVSGIKGQGEGSGWFRIPQPLVLGEPMLPVLRVATTADFCNGVSQTLLNDQAFINTDINLQLFREPIGEWIGVKSKCDIFPEGAGCVNGQFFDTRGQIGSVQQSVMATERFRG